ncbi:MAG: 50S ribosomal protein L5 [Candidatus Curtissbacteria bacterium GW2011_GWA1_40_9]|uniref:Large ribosomal subunit protein uL5 n=1 Tax=Candidatus Curtissbacteria bacterium GW2011_GWA1_40_9 TaxID=1618408 RepID=A0A0G0WRP3_9BACT|nr:MAG: 50S ribosomal protein L5 [Candidatus Curtissbacteria bacterium GW2011_GWA1_40_9]
MSLMSTYYQKVAPKLMEEFGVKNALALPRIEKVVINVGAAEALSSKDVLEKIKEQIAIITGQRPRITEAKKSISTFKLKEGDPIGVMVTLRGKMAWDFIEKFAKIIAPRIRDFRGLPDEKFDVRGNYSFGMTEQILFPQIDYAKVDKIRGLVFTIVIKNGDPEKSKKLLELLGLPFKK